jgi:hypothetical protein
MASNPLISQGTLNKLRGSVIYTDHQELNVTASYLAAEGISLAFEGDASGYLETMTGAVPSPNPYMMATVTLHLLKTQGLSTTYKDQFELDTTIGDLLVTTDTTTLDSYQLENCTLMRVNELGFGGRDPGFTVMVRGTYRINSSLFDLQ